MTRNAENWRNQIDKRLRGKRILETETNFINQLGIISLNEFPLKYHIFMWFPWIGFVVYITINVINIKDSILWISDT